MGLSTANTDPKQVPTNHVVPPAHGSTPAGVPPPGQAPILSPHGVGVTPPASKGPPPPPVPQDGVIALLTLGGTPASGDEQQQVDGVAPGKRGNAATSSHPPPFPPPIDLRDHLPRQRAEVPPGPGEPGAPRLPDDWLAWILPGESLRQVDVLCGRGGESNNFVGNRQFRAFLESQKPIYRQIPAQRRKVKTDFVQRVVTAIQQLGGRFIDVHAESKCYYVVTDARARKKTSQALRETKELKWIDLAKRPPKPMKKGVSNKNEICKHCGRIGHKTKIAKSCGKHEEWVQVSKRRPDEPADARQGQYAPVPSIPTQLGPSVVTGYQTGDASSQPVAYQTAMIPQNTNQ